ncbi:hypothetical protein GCM10010329_32120 [Streptomyces spiroverticillatus]|uniref:Uncharacterized protein n=1 Tax=Streptomyces finlayi TaxID=67296 RepID=A0A918WWL3_9ACTN|nr:hypothetical protein [Streptomyces finlayi]GHA07068.1 hypothetical protein GCM10010329_32120 [Streptomyces spiroverticillatus]GHC90493.1 hypothetical protein GCM10010334_24530 [Streptomyces finlayi]
MTEDAAQPQDAEPRAFRWETYRSEHPRQRDWSDGVVVTLFHVVPVGLITATQPWAGLVLGGVFGVFWGSLLIPPWVRDRRAVVAAEIGARGELVLVRRNGKRITRPLASVTAVRPLTVGYRSVDSSGDRILEVRVAGRTYRTRAGFALPANDPLLLADALCQACPDLVIGPHADKSSWSTDSG